MSLPAAEVRNLNYSYPSNPSKLVLQNLTFSIPNSKITAILGPNGSGKSTLFRILSTILPFSEPDKAFLLGHDVALHPSLIRKHIGVLFQHPALDPSLRCTENLYCAGLLSGIHGKQLQSKIMESLRAVGLEPQARSLVAHLSGGQQRRLEIARCLLTSPPLLLLDEPSTGLDPSARASCWQIFCSLAHQGTSLLLTTHLLEEAEKADYVLIFERGSLATSGSPAQLLHQLEPLVLSANFISPSEAQSAATFLQSQFAQSFKWVICGSQLRACLPDPHSAAAHLHNRFHKQLLSTVIAKPTLNDVFAFATGHDLREQETQTQMKST